MILYRYTAPGQGQATPWGQTFDVNRKPLSLCPLVAGLKKIALKSDFIYTFFMFHHNPGQGQIIHWGQNFDDNRKAFSLCPYVASFKMPQGKGRKPLGDKLLMSTESPYPLSLRPFVASFKQISLNSDFIHIF